MSGQQVVRLTRTHRLLIGGIVAGATVIAAIGFAGSYQAVRTLALRKGFGAFATVFPIGVDAGIAVLLALDLLLTWLRIPLPLLRQTAWLLTLATIAFNSAAAWPDPVGVSMHAVMPLLFVATVEAARHAVGRLTAITDDRHMEGVRLWRWVLAPVPTWLLWRRMRLWELRDYDEQVRLERDRIVAKARLRWRFGRGWRRLAPAEHVLGIRLARFGVPVPLGLGVDGPQSLPDTAARTELAVPAPAPAELAADVPPPAELEHEPDDAVPAAPPPEGERPAPAASAASALPVEPSAGGPLQAGPAEDGTEAAGVPAPPGGQEPTPAALPLAAGPAAPPGGAPSNGPAEASAAPAGSPPPGDGQRPDPAAPTEAAAHSTVVPPVPAPAGSGAASAEQDLAAQRTVSVTQEEPAGAPSAEAAAWTPQAVSPAEPQRADRQDEEGARDEGTPVVLDVIPTVPGPGAAQASGAPSGPGAATSPAVDGPVAPERATTSAGPVDDGTSEEHHRAVAAAAKDSDAIRYAMKVLGSTDRPAVVAWLRGVGREVNRGTVHRIASAVEQARQSED